MTFATRIVRANGVDFAVLEAGSGPLALCLHGFPDTAHTWRHLLPALAEAGFHAVAPFARGYAPTSIPQDGCYQLGALVADAVELHHVLEGDDSAVLIGHDWGAEAAYGAAAFAPERWRRLVTLAVPPLSLDTKMFASYEQLKRFFYLFYFGSSPSADAVVGADGMAFLDRLWQDWSPGYDATVDLAYVKDSLGDPSNLRAALAYYRSSRISAYEAQEAALRRQPTQPTLYLYGANDGCIGAEFSRIAKSELAPGSQVREFDAAGHFLQLERPNEVNESILAWVGH